MNGVVSGIIRKGRGVTQENTKNAGSAKHFHYVKIGKMGEKSPLR